MNSNPSAYLLLVLAMVFWGGNIVAGRAASGIVYPLDLQFWRLVLGGIILLPFALPKLRQQWGLVRRHWRLLACWAC